MKMIKKLVAVIAALQLLSSFTVCQAAADKLNDNIPNPTYNTIVDKTINYLDNNRNVLST